MGEVEDMLEKLAEIQHEIWAHWMKYLFDACKLNEDGSATIPADKVARWKRQMNTQYFDLPREEKDSDIEQAKKVVAVIQKNQTA